MKPQVNIIVVVDVIGALSDQTLLNGNLCMMDNGTGESTGQGTPDLCTVCRPGQLLQWVLHPVDVQTPAGIRSITFGDSGRDGDTYAPARGATSLSDSVQQTLEIWSGMVPPYMIPGVEYKYRLELQMYEGQNSIMSIDSCSLKCV